MFILSRFIFEQPVDSVLVDETELVQDTRRVGGVG